MVWPSRAQPLLMQLSCQISASGHAEVALRGELDLATADRVVGYVSDVIDRHDGPVIADLHDIAFCDACGLGALVRIVSYAERAGLPAGAGPAFPRPSRRSCASPASITGCSRRPAPRPTRPSARWSCPRPRLVWP